MRRTTAAWLLAMGLTATTLAWAGDTAGPNAACPPDCKPCPVPCAEVCPLSCN